MTNVRYNGKLKNVVVFNDKLRFECAEALLGYNSWQGFFSCLHIFFLSTGHDWIILIKWIVYDLQDVNKLELPNIKLPWTG